MKIKVFEGSFSDWGEGKKDESCFECFDDFKKKLLKMEFQKLPCFCDKRYSLKIDQNI